MLGVALMSFGGVFGGFEDEISSVADSNAGDGYSSGGDGDDPSPAAVSARKLAINYCFGCMPEVPSYFSGKDNISANGKACQVCLYEGRGVQQKDVVTCAAHRVRVCAAPPKKSAPMAEWLYKNKGPKYVQWICLDPKKTCWDKFHSFYVPHGLFPSWETVAKSKKDENKFVHPLHSSPLYQNRQEAILFYEKYTKLKFEHWKDKSQTNNRNQFCATAKSSGKVKSLKMPINSPSMLQMELSTGSVAVGSGSRKSGNLLFSK
jgi:hypothetical protein